MNEDDMATQINEETRNRGLAPTLWHHLKKARALATGLLVGSGQAMAALPTTAPPSRGTSSGNYIQLMQDYSYDIFLFLGLAVAVLAFFVVSKNTIGAYGEVQDGKGTWGQLGVNFGAGVLLLVFVVFLLTEAAAIL
jgi:integrating conjugative element membrane protein (TIGR03745 family)